MLQKPESVKLILFFGGIPGMNTDWQKNSLKQPCGEGRGVLMEEKLT